MERDLGAGRSAAFLRDVHAVDGVAGILGDEGAVAAMRERLVGGDLVIVKNAVDTRVLERITRYLAAVGQSSLPTYERVDAGAPNFHRVARWDPRSYVQGCFHQFSFFPWNQDVFGFFDLFRDVYRLKNRLSGLAAERFLGTAPDDGCIARLSFQFYPAGGGGLNRHVDPVDRHQLTVPIMTMSRKGTDFKDGGVFIERANGERVILDDLTAPGDVSFFNAQAVHGVAPIDPTLPLDWLEFRGRWMLLFAVNRLHANTTIPDAVDLGR